MSLWPVTLTIYFSEGVRNILFTAKEVLHRPKKKCHTWKRNPINKYIFLHVTLYTVFYRRRPSDVINNEFKTAI